MKIDQFVEMITSRLSKELGDGFIVSYQKILKNNSVEHDSLVIHREGSAVAPAIYISGFYLEYINGREMDDIIKEILKVLNASRETVSDDFLDKVDLSGPEDMVFMKLVNYEKNKKLLKNCLYDRVLDLAVIYCFLIQLPGGFNGSVKLSSENASVFGLTPEKIRKAALENTMRLYPPEFDSMDNFFKRFIDFPMDFQTKLFLLTTKGKQDGAVSILYTGILERIRKAIGSDFYIIPSSIHEVIIVPEGFPNTKEVLEGMVREVNSTCVPKHEILSDRIYHYPKDQFELSCVGSDP